MRSEHLLAQGLEVSPGLARSFAKLLRRLSALELDGWGNRFHHAGDGPNHPAHSLRELKWRARRPSLKRLEYPVESRV
jgi:hypothetical protein